MTYIENIFLCLAIPLLLSLFFTKDRARSFILFIIASIGACLLSAYVGSFFIESSSATVGGSGTPSTKSWMSAWAKDTNILSYHDAQDISEHAFSAMQWVCGESILNGSNGNLMPQGIATRARVRQSCTSPVKIF